MRQLSRLALACGVWSSHARADLGDDLGRVQQSLGIEGRSQPLRLRLLERGDVLPIVMPPWTLDASGGDCTTLVLLAPVPTQFVVRVHPWQDLPSTFVSRAGAFQLTRCGKARISLVHVSVELRSPRAVLYPLVAVGAEPAPLEATLPQRDAGPDAPSRDPGPAPAREPLQDRLERFDVAARGAGATSTERLSLPSSGPARLLLAPGCHRLLVSARTAGVPAAALLALGDDAPAERLEPTSTGDVRHQLCTLLPRNVAISSTGSADEPTLAVAHFPLPQGLPQRFGVTMAERLLSALGHEHSPRKLGPVVVATLGAQGRTPLPQKLLPHSCYLAVVVVARGSAPSLALRATSSGTTSTEGTGDGGPGARVAFCTDKGGRADVEVEARGLGLTWLFVLFQQGPGPGVAR